MLLRSSLSKTACWAVFAIVMLALVAAPIAVTVITALSKSWSGVLPSGFTLDNVRQIVQADNLASISVSIQTAIIASACAVFVGTWAAIAAHDGTPRIRRVLDTAFHLPVAVPSVVVGLGMLVAFSKPPVLLNGTATIVILVQAVLVLSFAYSTVSGAVAALNPRLSQVAGSLGASGFRILLSVKLPLLLPAIAAAAGLSIAMCMGELGATIMVYPASWRTLPISIFAAADRGDIFTATANTLLLVLVTTLILALLSLLRRGRKHTAPAR